MLNLSRRAAPPKESLLGVVLIIVGTIAFVLGCFLIMRMRFRSTFAEAHLSRIIVAVCFAVVAVTMLWFFWKKAFLWVRVLFLLAPITELLNVFVFSDRIAYVLSALLLMVASVGFLGLFVWHVVCGSVSWVNYAALCVMCLLPIWYATDLSWRIAVVKDWMLLAALFSALGFGLLGALVLYLRFRNMEEKKHDLWKTVLEGALIVGVFVLFFVYCFFTLSNYSFDFSSPGETSDFRIYDREIDRGHGRYSMTSYDLVIARGEQEFDISVPLYIYDTHDTLDWIRFRYREGFLGCPYYEILWKGME